ncbi:MAG: DUF2306 domain-containing protein [Planctomycetales bacterium]|nr:DUF2306 domain-containing protein [Planctomycetales bacterium]
MPALIAKLRVLAYFFIAKSLLLIVANYGSYFPPDFHADFLLGRRSYFSGAYAWAFYVHLVAGPLSLAAALALMSSRVQRLRAVHRWLGRALVVLVLTALAPSGLWMARYAAGGWAAAAGFATLAVGTACCAAMGWSCARKRKFATHRQWMTRCFLLLSSTAVLRFVGAVSELADAEWTYRWSAWGSWLIPLAIYEGWRLFIGGVARDEQQRSASFARGVERPMFPVPVEADRV